MVFYFGSWERRGDQNVYMISARCDCIDPVHRMEYMLSPTDLNTFRIDPFSIIKARMDYKFEKAHRISIHL